MTIADALAPVPVASPELLVARELQRRIDVKFLLDAARVPEVIAALAGSHSVLGVGTTNVATYENLYFDTAELRCFHDHRRGRRLRQKVRIRHYPDRALSFLEVKTKRTLLVTDKKRRAVDFHCETLGDADRAFLRVHIPDTELVPQLRIDYSRIGLLDREHPERLTIDYALVATRADRRCELGALAVVEVKRAPDARQHTPAIRALLAAGARERSLSKYCAALVLLQPEVRHNRLLPTMRALEALR